MAELTRRGLLGSAVGTLGGAAALSLFPPPAERAEGREARRDGLLDGVRQLAGADDVRRPSAVNVAPCPGPRLTW
ncbi:twin-arginine translocation signal domain-containing protein [Streptomyces sp. QTS52]